MLETRAYGSVTTHEQRRLVKIRTHRFACEMNTTPQMACASSNELATAPGRERLPHLSVNRSWSVYSWKCLGWPTAAAENDLNLEVPGWRLLGEGGNKIKKKNILRSEMVVTRGTRKFHVRLGSGNIDSGQKPLKIGPYFDWAGPSRLRQTKQATPRIKSKRTPQALPTMPAKLCCVMGRAISVDAARPNLRANRAPVIT